MSVDAIGLLQEAESQAAKKQQAAEVAKEQLAKESKSRIEVFRQELLKEEQQKQQAIKEKLRNDLIASKKPLLEDTAEEIETLRSISDELRKKALAIIINKVVT